MSESKTRFSVICLALFLFTLSVTVFKPGMPPTLKADEPAYFLSALSLAHDGDLICEDQDYRRLEHTYPWLPVENLILMSDDGWKTVLFGKPYLYPLLAAPLAVFFGANGLIALNALLFVAMIWMGAVYLERFNSSRLALLFSLGFFFLSPTFAYVFWLQPEIFNMASVMASFFVALHRFELPGDAGGPAARIWRRLFNETTRPAWSGALLAFGAYNKPVLGVLALPLLYSLWRRRGLKSVVQWCAASLLALGVFAGVSTLLTGHPTAYLGVARSGVKVEDWRAMPEVISHVEEQLEERSTTANSWSWMFDGPPFDWPDFFEDLSYFFWGRHTGFLLYLPLAVLALALFLVHNRRSVTGWWILASAFALALFFIVKIPINWHGGGGFVGNRYFINAYPVFLFLVTAVRPRWTVALAYAVGGLFLGPIVFTPFGASVPRPGLQAHARSAPYKYFPLELSIRQAVPGYTTVSFPGISLIGRGDLFKSHQPAQGVTWIHGAVKTPILVLSETPLDSAFFEVRTWAPDNKVTFKLAGDEKAIEFAGAVRNRQRNQTVELTPRRIDRRTYDAGKPTYVYNLEIEVENGQRIIDHKDPSQIFYVGVQLRYLGRRDQVGAPQHYRLEWLSAELDRDVQTDKLFEVRVRARNRCYAAVSSSGPLPVRLGYHWVDQHGERVPPAGRRTSFRGVVEPGEVIDATMTVRAPDRPGRYTLVLDAVREHVAWFSERGGATHRVSLDIEKKGTVPFPSTAGGSAEVD